MSKSLTIVEKCNILGDYCAQRKYLKAGNENVKLLKKSSGWRIKRGRDEEGEEGEEGGSI